MCEERNNKTTMNNVIKKICQRFRKKYRLDRPLEGNADSLTDEQIRNVEFALAVFDELRQDEQRRLFFQLTRESRFVAIPLLGWDYIIEELIQFSKKPIGRKIRKATLNKAIRAARRQKQRGARVHKIALMVDGSIVFESYEPKTARFSITRISKTGRCSFRLCKRD